MAPWPFKKTKNDNEALVVFQAEEPVARHALYEHRLRLGSIPHRRVGRGEQCSPPRQLASQRTPGTGATSVVFRP
jgi:hypothetical protein